MPYTKIIGVCLVTLFFVSCDLERDNPLDMNKGNKEIVLSFDSLVVVTDNNNDKQINKGESIKLTVVLKNNGSSSANKVRGTISCASSYISALSPTTSTPYYRNGVTSNDYIDAGGVGYGFSNLSFNVSSTTPAGTVIPFSIAITDESNNTWSDSFTITIVATAELPNDVCNISSTTTGTTFIVISPSQQIFRYGDNYTITLSSETFSFGQATSVDLYRNETLTYSYGTFLLFDNNSRTFSLPNSIPASRCYTFRILTGSDIYITNSFTVH